MATPGDSVFQIGTIHINANDKNCVVEVQHGVLRKDGTAHLVNENVVVPWEAIGAMGESVKQYLTDHFMSLTADNQPACLRDAVPYAPKPVVVDEAPKAEKPKAAKAK